MTRAEGRGGEERIEMRIIVDTYSPEEQAWGWCEYLDDTMDPFEARCVTEQEESPLEEGETVRVVGMSPTDPTLSQMFVTIEWMDRTLGVPLEQLEPIEASSKDGPSDRRLAVLARSLTTVTETIEPLASAEGQTYASMEPEEPTY